MMSKQQLDYRFEALWRFAIAITILNVLGHTVFGFEQAWAQPLVALATAYSVEIILEIVDAHRERRAVRFAGGVHSFLNFILPAHITGLAVAMLLYANDRLFPIMFAAAVAIGSKAIFRIPTARGSRHFLNPSNFGITMTLLLFPWVGIAPPYHFTENLVGVGDWILPGIIIASGTFLNSRFTKKIPLLAGWLLGFSLQAIIRSLFFHTPISAALLPMSGLAFVLFTFYMVTDPGTTPFAPKAQFLFGAVVALVYALLMMLHVVFGLFFALTIVSVVSGLNTYLRSLAVGTVQTHAAAPLSTLVRRSDL